MLKGISPLLSPELLATLCRMGHGDELVIADAHFPGHSLHRRVLRADGLLIPPLLDAILALLPLDRHGGAPALMMAPVEGDEPDPEIEARYRQVIAAHESEGGAIEKLERFAFYERTRQAFAVVMSGDTATYANIVLRKGVTPSAGCARVQR